MIKCVEMRFCSIYNQENIKVGICTLLTIYSSLIRWVEQGQRSSRTYSSYGTLVWVFRSNAEDLYSWPAGVTSDKHSFVHSFSSVSFPAHVQLYGPHTSNTSRMSFCVNHAHIRSDVHCFIVSTTIFILKLNLLAFDEWSLYVYQFMHLCFICSQRFLFFFGAISIINTALNQ